MLEQCLRLPLVLRLGLGLGTRVADRFDPNTFSFWYVNLPVRFITAESTAKLKAPSLLSSRISSRFLLATLCTPLFLCVYSRFSITPPSGRAQRFWLGRTHCSACPSTAISCYRSESVIIPYSKVTALYIPVWLSTTRQLPAHYSDKSGGINDRDAAHFSLAFASPFAVFGHKLNTVRKDLGSKVSQLPGFFRGLLDDHKCCSLYRG